jgi:hypothetical protein
MVSSGTVAMRLDEILLLSYCTLRQQWRLDMIRTILTRFRPDVRTKNIVSLYADRTVFFVDASKMCVSFLRSCHTSQNHQKSIEHFGR